MSEWKINPTPAEPYEPSEAEVETTAATYYEQGAPSGFTRRWADEGNFIKDSTRRVVRAVLRAVPRRPALPETPPEEWIEAMARAVDNVVDYDPNVRHGELEARAAYAALRAKLGAK